MTMAYFELKPFLSSDTTMLMSWLSANIYKKVEPTKQLVEIKYFYLNIQQLRLCLNIAFHER